MKKLLFALLFVSSMVDASEVRELVSPYAPGGVVSSFGRVLQKHISEDLKIDMVLVNKPGADARIGVKYVANQPADGKTWIVAATGPFLFNQVVYEDPGYNVKDFDLILPMAQSPSIIAVSNHSGISTLKEFVNRAQTQSMNCGVSNSGALFLTKYVVSKLKLTGVEIVNFKGASEVSMALMNGTIDCSVDTLQSQLRYHQDSKLKIIALSSISKNELLPTADLFSTVIPNFSFYSWYGIGVLKSAPSKDKDVILKAMRNINQNESYRNNIQALGLELGNPATDPHKFIQMEYQRFDAIRQAGGIAKQN